VLHGNRREQGARRDLPVRIALNGVRHQCLDIGQDAGADEGDHLRERSRPKREQEKKKHATLLRLLSGRAVFRFSPDRELANDHAALLSPLGITTGRPEHP
jgi:hypothetical protein